eukprot:m.918292 g.918292  ORF g.918292 m.918292 type:complete len:331 (+) comp23743_c1_seq9:161-1153(+)
MFQSDRSNMWSHHHKHASPSFPPTWVVLTLLSALDTSAQSTWSPEPKVIDEVPEAQYEVSQPDESSESRKIVSVAIFGTIGILLVIAVVTGRRYCNATRLDNSPRINSSVESFSPADSHIHAGIGADILDNNERGLITPKRNAILDFSLVSSTSPQSECVTINGDQTLNDTATLGTRGRGSFSTCKTSNAAQLLGSEFSEEARVLTFDDSCCDENTEIAGDRSLFVPFDTNSSETTKYDTETHGDETAMQSACIVVPEASQEIGSEDTAGRTNNEPESKVVDFTLEYPVKVGSEESPDDTESAAGFHTLKFLLERMESNAKSTKSQSDEV